MRKTLGIVFLLVIVLSLVAIWQKPVIINYLRPVKVLQPIFKEPSIYDLTALLAKNGLSFSTPPILINGTIQATVSGITVLFTPDKDFFPQVRSLQLVLPRLKMEGKPVTEIDLRYNKVIIKY